MVGLLLFEYPEAVDVAVLVDGCYFFFCVEDRFGCVFRVCDLEALSGLEYDERDVMLGHHGVRYASYGYFDPITVKTLCNGYMFFCTGVIFRGNQLFHLFTAANHRNLGVDYFDCYVATMATSVKFCFHCLIFNGLIMT